MFKITKDHHVLISPVRFSKELDVGIIENGSYYINDKDCYYEAGNAYGVDEEVLLDEHLSFKLVMFKRQQLITTRIYFVDHSIRYNLLNGRVMTFLSEGQFGLVKALHYERSIRNSEVLKMQYVGDVLALDNPRLFREWEKVIEQEERAKELSQNKSKIKL